ncbi:MAG: hypothetical protein FOGNACKC_00729 [Anaerolineae bacterium]|nr:hypothetical protein [Anaerolineae bacterium]
MNVIKNPQTNQCFVDLAQYGQICAFDGTPYSRPADADTWPVVGGDVPFVADWIKNPAQYGTGATVAVVYLFDEDGQKFSDDFTVGGDPAKVQKWLGYMSHCRALAFRWFGAFESLAEAALVADRMVQ